MVRAAIGLGSNLGDRSRHITEAIESLRQAGPVVAASPLYETAPIGGPDQGPYLNAVVVIETDLSPRQLLDACLDIERSHGRERLERWGPRTLDLDILLFGAEEIDQAGLTVPHPRLGERRFVLEPLLAVWPDARLPDGTPVAALLDSVSEQQVARFEPSPPARSFTAAAIAVTIAGALAIWWIGDWLVGRF